MHDHYHPHSLPASGGGQGGAPASSGRDTMPSLARGVDPFNLDSNGAAVDAGGGGGVSNNDENDDAANGIGSNDGGSGTTNGSASSGNSSSSNNGEINDDDNNDDDDESNPSVHLLLFTLSGTHRGKQIKAVGLVHALAPPSNAACQNYLGDSGGLESLLAARCAAPRAATLHPKWTKVELHVHHSGFSRGLDCPIEMLMEEKMIYEPGMLLRFIFWIINHCIDFIVAGLVTYVGFSAMASISQERHERRHRRHNRGILKHGSSAPSAAAAVWAGGRSDGRSVSPKSKMFGSLLSQNKTMRYANETHCLHLHSVYSGGLVGGPPPPPP